MQCRVLTQFLGITSYANVIAFLEHNRLVDGSVDYQNTNILILHGNYMIFEIGVLRQKAAQPIFNFLISFFQCLEIIFRSDNLVCLIMDTP